MALLAFGGLLSACNAKPVQTDEMFVAPAPALESLSNQPEVTDELTAAIREALEGTLKFDPYTETALDFMEIEG